MSGIAQSGWLEIAVAVALFGGLLGSFELGCRLGGRPVEERPEADTVPIGALQGATMGLLGLLLGFSFAGASSRFIDRQDLIVAEANAIGTAYLRADLLAEPFRGELQAALREYLTRRVAVFEGSRRGWEDLAQAEAGSSALHAELWRSALDGVRAAPQLAVSVLPPVNDVIDLHTTRAAAMRRHLPAAVLGVLVASACVAIGTLGYGFGLAGRSHRLLGCAVAFLVGATLWLTIDLDYPSRGLIRSYEAPLRDLESSLAAP